MLLLSGWFTFYLMNTALQLIDFFFVLASKTQSQMGGPQLASVKDMHLFVY